MLKMQVKWELGSSIVGPLLRRYGPHDTYSVGYSLQLGMIASSINITILSLVDGLEMQPLYWQTVMLSWNRGILLGAARS